MGELGVHKLPIIIIVVVVDERCLAVQFLRGKILDIMEDVAVCFLCCFLRRAPSQANGQMHVPSQDNVVRNVESEG